jgi:hypothetical protein
MTHRLRCAYAAFVSLKPLYPDTNLKDRIVSITHAVLWTDHQAAQVLQFDAEHVRAEKVRAHHHYTRQHHSAVRTEHEFFSDVCGALNGIDEVLVTGSHTAVADFRHYVEKHRPLLAARITGYEVVDHPTDKQLVALARQYFLKHERMRGITNPF